MSILETFKKLIDPEQARLEEQAKKSLREQPSRDDEGGTGDEPRFRCKVCGHLAHDKIFCPSCLADTLEPLPRG